MPKKELVRRYLLFIISLFFSALGVALTKHGELGVSPISSVANVLSLRLPALSLGTWLILWNCVLIVGQIIILRRKFQLVQLLQIPLSFVFGWFTDLGMLLVSPIPAGRYPVRILLVLAGIAVLAFGIALAVIANVVMNSGEAFVKAISDTISKPFGNVKIVFDITCVVLAVVLSLLLFGGQIAGTREGTLLSAVLTGICVKFWNKLLHHPVEALLTK